MDRLHVPTENPHPSRASLRYLLPLTLVIALIASACQTTGGQASPSPRGAATTPAAVTDVTTAAPTATDTPTPSPTPTPSGTSTPSPTSTPVPTSTPTPAPKPTPKPTPAPTRGAGATPGASPGSPDPRWAQALHTQDGGVVGVVTTASLNIRSAPTLRASIVDTTYQRHTITVYQNVAGDPVQGSTTWYRVGQGRYVAAAYVSPFVPPAPPRTYSGHWVDVRLSQFYAVAYDGTTPVYAAIITAGRDGKTPTGVFQVQRRVRNETMDSATVGIPKGSPGYYYLTNVQ